MINKNHQYLYRSPFNFLDPYTKDDEHIFFGREQEIDDVFMLFEKTNLVVIYGPSGSGKSSVAQCGLVNRFFDWKPIEIRRNLNIIDSFFEAIEIETNSNNVPIKGLFSTEECQKLRSIFDQLTINTSAENYDPDNDEVLKELRKIIEKLYMNLSIIPFFIFDQFEELFIENHDSVEIESFSLLLSLITKNISYSNVVLCIQTEFFSNLVRLEGHNPNILNYKCEINDPNEDNIRKIIRGTFKKFNINQVYDGTKDKIPDDKKEFRIDEIIERIAKVGLHLPFVQIYLDKLYVLDFDITYPDDIELLRNSENIDTKKFSLEFKVDEIQKYGEIKEILKRYIDEVSTQVIKTKNLLHKKKEDSEYAVIKLLKYFITNKDTRKSIKVWYKPRGENTKSSYFVLEQPYQQKIIEDIWDDTIKGADETIGDIIDELLKARILKYRNEQLEFSHNFLVKVVNDAKVPEDVKDIYKREFNSAFEAYVYEDESRNELLTKTKIKKFEPYISQILNSDKDQNDKKEKFWNRSKILAARKKWSRIGVTVATALVVGVLVGYFSTRENAKMNAEKDVILELNQAKKDKERVEVKGKLISAFKTGKTDVTESYRLFSDAFEKIKSDTSLTKSEFQYELQVYDNLIQNYNFEPFYSKKIKLLVNGKRPKIEITKHRTLNNSSIVLFALTPDNLYSKQVTLDKKEATEEWNPMFKNESGFIISSFEPYFNQNGKLRVLISSSDGLFDISYKFEPNGLKMLRNEDKFKNLKSLDKFADNRFVAFDKDKKKIIAIDISSNRNQYFNVPSRLELIKLQSLGGKSNAISYIGIDKKRRDSVFIYQHFWNAHWLISDLKIKLPPSYKNTISKSFKLDTNENQILFEDDRQVYSINFNQFNKDTVNITTKLNSYHKQNINSLAKQDNYYLLGSDDKTASLFYDRNPQKEGEEKMVKRLRGHTDALINVSFIGNNRDYVLTTSEDATFVIWDIRKTADTIVERFQERNDIRIKFINDNLYIAHDKGNEGYLLNLNKNSLAIQNTIKPISKNSDIFNLNGSYCAFDFDPVTNQIFTALRYNRRILTFDLEGKNSNEVIGWNSKTTFNDAILDVKVFDLAVQNKKIALATENGIFYFSNYNTLEKFNDTVTKRDNYKLKGSNNEIIESWINTVEFHPSKPWLIASSKNGNIYHYDLENKSCKVLANGHKDRVEMARFSPDGNFIFSGSWDNKVIIWQLNNTTGTYIKKHEILSHSSDIETIAVTKLDNSLIIASGSSDKTVQLHKMPVAIEINENIEDFIERLPSIITHDYGVRSITFGESPSIIYTVDALGIIKKWNWQEFKNIIETRTAN